MYNKINIQNERLLHVMTEVSSIKNQLTNYDLIENQLKEQYEKNKKIEEEINEKMLLM